MLLRRLDQWIPRLKDGRADGGVDLIQPHGAHRTLKVWVWLWLWLGLGLGLTAGSIWFIHTVHIGP